MNKDYYSVEDIILGLRGEYIRHYEELAQLKRFVITDDRRVKDYNFRLFQPCEHKPNLYLDFDVKKNRLKSMMYLFLLKFGWDTKCYGKDTSKVLRDFNDEFSLSGFYNAYIMDDPEFARKVKAIMESEFAQNISAQLFNPKMMIEHNAIYTGQSPISLWYYPKVEILSLCDITFGGLQDSLAVQVPKDNFPEYHQKHIEAYLEEQKEVIIDDMMPMSRIMNYKIEETDDALTLRRVKTER